MPLQGGMRGERVEMMGRGGEGVLMRLVIKGPVVYQLEWGGEGGEGKRG